MVSEVHLFFSTEALPFVVCTDWESFIYVPVETAIFFSTFIVGFVKVNHFC